MSRSRLPLLGAALGATVLMLALVGSASSFGPTASSTWVVSGGQNGGGVVTSTAVSGSTAYLGGNFTYVGPPTGSFVAADSAGTLVAPWPAVGGNVYAVAPDGANGFFIGGEFSSIGARHANNVAHIKSDGTLDTAWVGGTDGTVYALAVSGGTVYAGGDFDHAGSSAAARTNLAAFSASTGALVTAFTGNATGPGAAVLALEALGPTLYVGGDFATLGGSSHANLGAVDAGTGVATAWTANTDDVVYALTVGGGVVYVGGAFQNVNVNLPRDYLAAFDSSTAAPTNWDPVADAEVFALEYTPTAVYAGGTFSLMFQTPRNGLAALDPQNVGDATSWNPNVAGEVYSLGISGSTVYAGGLFGGVNGGTPRDNAAGFDTTTGTATGFAPVVGGTGDALAVSGTKVGIGGEFRSVGAGGPTAGPVPRTNLAAIDLTTGRATTWDPGANDTVEVLSVSGSVIYAGGAFTVVDGQVRERLAAFNTAGDATNWNPGVHNGEVLALTVVGNTVYAGGSFSGAGSVSNNPPVQRNHVAAFFGSGVAVGSGFGDLTGWNPNANGTVFALDSIGSTVFLGGGFTSLAPTGVTGGPFTRNRLASVSAGTTATPTTWNPNANGTVSALTHVGAIVYAGGAFTTVNGNVTRGGGAAFSASGTGTANDWNPETFLGPNLPGTVYALAASGSTMYLSGVFRSVGGPWTGSPTACSLPCFLSPSVAAVSLDLGVPNIGWAPAADDLVLSLALAPQGLVMGGVFTATGFPPPGSPFNADEPAVAYRGGFALVRALPDAPTNVIATPGDTTARVTWQAPAYTGGGPVTSYAIIVDSDGRVLTDVTSPATVTGLTNGVAQTFSVIAITSTGIGEAGVSNSVTPHLVPGAPTGVTGTPLNGKVSVSFTPPASSGGSAITSYTVTASPGNVTASGASSPILVSGLANDTAYTFTVTATNAAGSGPASAPSSAVTPSATLTAPGAPTAVVGTRGNGQAVVSFTPPTSDGGTTITSYTVTATPGGQTATSAGTAILVTGLTNGVGYTFTVTATNGIGTGSPSDASAPIVPAQEPRHAAPDPPSGEAPRREIPDFVAPTGPRPQLPER